MWWRFPYTNFHELNLDWILQKIKDFQNYLNGVDETIEQDVHDKVEGLVNSGYFEDLVDAEALDGIKAKVENIIAVSAIRAKNPTYTDDQLIEEALSQARSQCYDRGVIKWDKNTANFVEAHTVRGVAGIDFNGATLKMPNNNIVLFTIKNNSETSSMSVPASAISGNKTTNAVLKGKIFHLAGNSTKTFGVRNHSTDSTRLDPNWLVVTDKDGGIDNVAINDRYYPEEGNVTCYNVHEYPNTHFVIENAVIDYGTTNTLCCQFLRMERSNSEIRNIRIKGAIVASSAYLGTVISVNTCYNVTVRNIVGDNPVRDENSGYILSGWAVSNMRVLDCFLGDYTDGSWGATAFDWCSNLLFENCLIERIDSHYAHWGEYTVRNCVVNVITYGVGCGNLKVENTTFIIDGTSTRAILHRGDIGGLFEGNIVVDSCVLKASTGADMNNFVLLDCQYGAINTNSSISTADVPGTVTLRNMALECMGLIIFGSPNDTFELRSNYTVLVENVQHLNHDKGICILTQAIANYWRIKQATFIGCSLDVDMLYRGNIGMCNCEGTLFNKAFKVAQSTNDAEDGWKTVQLIGCSVAGFDPTDMGLITLIVIGCVATTNTANNRNGVKTYIFMGNSCPPGGKSWWNANNLAE